MPRRGTFYHRLVRRPRRTPVVLVRFGWCGRESAAARL